jgi:hypothetical protein
MAPPSAGKINYTPKLSKEYEKLMSQPMGKTIKGFLVYDTPWWRNKKNSLKSYSGYYGGIRNSKLYNDLYKKKTGKEDKLIFTWFFDNSIDNDGVYVLMFFIVAENVDVGKIKFNN